ncbi:MULTISPECIES: TIGR04282 family arsenosugar biosynthesis glycosyltransferase [unclassified Thioalkalivibrio]|uniref:TIGR04282 family arsenosugar biosynthesis glycosyltransferase n=1 Tax=unclassified Thioalkalivibrio TaxID=2621013 RepID=UPI0004760B1C|nr:MULTISPECIES: TIGR04282 family arsenosugar biosynthesis glycosyltransferase [unclassified Thioalkalivibrio]
MPERRPTDAPRVLVFARAPEPGRTKTRLIPALGAKGAARLHERLLEHALDVARQVAPDHVELWCTPDTDHPFLERCAERFGCSLHSQVGDDLGARMRHALEVGPFPALVMGSDAPTLGVGDLVAARKALAEGADVALIPALDGGYVLLAAARPVPGLFEAVEWGSDRVLEQTRERAQAQGLVWAELEARADIDRPEDLVHCPPVLLRGIGAPRESPIPEQSQVGPGFG